MTTAAAILATDPPPPEPQSDDRVLAAIAEMRADMCLHLHAIEADVQQLRQRAAAIEADIKSLTEGHERTSARVEHALRHDTDHEKRVAEEILLEQEKRAALEAQLKKLEAELVIVRASTESIERMSTEAYTAGKKLAANPIVRTIATAVLATGGIWATGLNARIANPSPAPVVAAATGLTAYERDLMACSGSAACEESVRGRHWSTAAHAPPPAASAPPAERRPAGFPSASASAR
jgi:hypothetical protein